MTVAEAMEIHEVEDVTEIDPIPKGYELIEGVLVEKPNLGAESSLVVGRIFRRLDTWCEGTKLGIAVTGEAGYRCFDWKPKLVRKPDSSVILCEPASLVVPKGDFRIAPDLVVEVVSPNDRVSELDEKIGEFLEAGTRLVWIVNPELRTVLIRRANGTLQLLSDPAELSGEDVLPGFAVALADFLPKIVAPTTDVPS